MSKGIQFTDEFKQDAVARAGCAIQRIPRMVEEPLSVRALEDVRQTDLIRKAWTDSGKVYGYRN